MVGDPWAIVLSGYALLPFARFFHRNLVLGITEMRLPGLQRVLRGIFLIPIFVVTHVSVVYAAPPGTLLHKFTAPDGALNVDFGYGLATTNNNAFITDQFAPGGGRTYEFDMQGDLVRTITNPGGNTSARFGDRVAVVGNYVAVSATGELTNGQSGQGSVFLFDASTGALERGINAPAGSLSFGQALAGSGNLLVVGGFGDPVNVFNADTGQVVQTLHDPTNQSEDAFGSSVLIYNQMVFVGAPQDTAHHSAGSTGVVYGFDLSTGNLLHVYGDQFNVPHGMGWTMSIVNGDLLVGDPTSQTGAAFEFDINTGAVLHQMHQPAGTGGATFGADVAAVGGLEAVGMSPSGQAPGAAYLYSSGTLVQTINSPSDGFDHDFAQTIEAWGPNLLVGDVQADAGGRGAAYLYSVPEPSSIALLIIGAIGLAAMARSRTTCVCAQRRVGTAVSCH
ncbi:MAG TPA: PEP-CTERM sorting domain-containing protein [Pirellulales bacterium]